jgi:hypothetical protein
MTDRLAGFGGVLKSCLNLLDKSNNPCYIVSRYILYIDTIITDGQLPRGRHGTVDKGEHHQG